MDADHAGNFSTRRSHTGILVDLNNSLIICFSKQQNKVEPSSFGSKFVALIIAKELLVSLRYKLRMFDMTIDGPADFFIQSVREKEFDITTFSAEQEAQCNISSQSL